MHTSDTCTAGCGCPCPFCEAAGPHPRHAGPLAILQDERDPVTVSLADELAPAAGRIEAYPTPARCCDWSSGHPKASPIDETAHGPADRDLVRAGLR